MPHSPLLTRNNWFWLIVAVVALVVLWLLRGILMPFVLAMILAYCLDPVADRLERIMPRGLAVGLLSLLTVLLMIAVLLLVIPPLVSQAISLVQNTPKILDTLQGRVTSFADWAYQMAPTSLFGERAAPESVNTADFWGFVKSLVGAENAQEVQARLTESVGSIAQVSLTLARTVWSGSLALINALSFVFITPILTFYLLRDWDKMTATIDGLLPRRSRPKIRRVAREADSALAGFIRGQSMVIVIMTLFYCVTLGLLGLNFWLVVGLVAGLLSFIPILGSVIGFVLAIGLALFQFDSVWPILLTVVIYQAGQILEGNILTPNLVGEKVGLHPVWVMFALFASGALFGFLGILFAVPMAGVIGVCVRFLVREYKTSSVYSIGRTNS